MLLVILAVSATLRFSYNAETLNRGRIQADAANYITYAENILNYSTFSKDRKNKPPTPDAYWSPGYPAFLASNIVLAKITNHDAYNVVLYAQLVLGLATVVFSYLISTTFLTGYWPLVPAALVALSPHLVAIGQNVLTETLFGFLLITSIYSYILGVSRNRQQILLVAGIGLALGWLVNPVSILAAPLLVLTSYFMRQDTEGKHCISFYRKILLVVVPAIVVVTIWSVRTEVNVPPCGRLDWRSDWQKSHSWETARLVPCPLPTYNQYLFIRSHSKTLLLGESLHR